MNTLTKARRLVEKENREANVQRITAKVHELEAAAAQERASRERQEAERRAAAAEAACLPNAPTITMAYGDVTVTFRLAGRDSQERLIVAEALRRAERIFAAAFATYVARQRAQAVAGQEFPPDPIEGGLAARLAEELRFAIRLGHVEVK